MQQTDSLDQQALACAKTYMGSFAWPTVIFALVVFAAYLATIAMGFTGLMPLWLAVPLVGVISYLAYTVLHEAAHGTISGSVQSRRWINEALGYTAAWVIMIPLTAHRHEHLAHHRHTNDAQDDPDYHVGDLRNSPFSALTASTKIYWGQFSYYMTQRWQKAPARQNLYFCLEIAAALLPRLGLLAAGFWVESLALFVVAWLLGVTLTLYLFAYLVHRPHEDVGRYVDTSVILAPRGLNGLLTWLWVFQNYHAIHHLFPRVPFYQYAKLFAEIEPIMEQKGSPIYRLEMAGMKRRAPLSHSGPVPGAL